MPDIPGMNMGPTNIGPIAPLNQQSQQGQLQDLIMLKHRLDTQADILSSLIQVYSLAADNKQSETRRSQVIEQVVTPQQGHVGETETQVVQSRVGGNTQETEWNDRKLIKALMQNKQIPKEVLEKAESGPHANLCKVYKARRHLQEQMQKMTRMPGGVALPRSPKLTHPPLSTPLNKELSSHPTETEETKTHGTTKAEKNATTTHAHLHSDPFEVEDSIENETEEISSGEEASGDETDAEIGEQTSGTGAKAGGVPPGSSNTPSTIGTSGATGGAAGTPPKLGAQWTPPPIPADWKKDPQAWVFYLLHWFVLEDLFPGAYQEISILAIRADQHNRQAGYLQSILSDWFKFIGMSKFIPSSQLAAWRANVKRHSWWTSAHNKSMMQKVLGKIFSWMNLYTDMKKRFSNPALATGTFASQFRSLHKMFDGPFGAGKPFNWQPKWGQFFGLISAAVHDKTWPPILWNNPLLTQMVSQFDKQLEAHPTVPTVHHTSKWRDVTWSRALNNTAPSGPWGQFEQVEQSLSNSLSTASNDDQNNLRIAYYALTTKTNAASNLLTTLGQMVSQMAQNMRTSG